MEEVRSYLEELESHLQSGDEDKKKRLHKKLNKIKNTLEELLKAEREEKETAEEVAAKAAAAAEAEPETHSAPVTLESNLAEDNWVRVMTCLASVPKAKYHVLPCKSIKQLKEAQSEIRTKEVKLKAKKAEVKLREAGVKLKKDAEIVRKKVEEKLKKSELKQQQKANKKKKGDKEERIEPKTESLVKIEEEHSNSATATTVEEKEEDVVVDQDLQHVKAEHDKMKMELEELKSETEPSEDALGVNCVYTIVVTQSDCTKKELAECMNKLKADNVVVENDFRRILPIYVGSSYNFKPDPGRRHGFMATMVELARLNRGLKSAMTSQEQEEYRSDTRTVLNFVSKVDKNKSKSVLKELRKTVGPVLKKDAIMDRMEEKTKIWLSTTDPVRYLEKDVEACLADYGVMKLVDGIKEDKDDTSGISEREHVRDIVRNSDDGVAKEAEVLEEVKRMFLRDKLKTFLVVVEVAVTATKGMESHLMRCLDFACNEPTRYEALEAMDVGIAEFPPDKIDDILEMKVRKKKLNWDHVLPVKGAEKAIKGHKGDKAEHAGNGVEA